MDKSRDELIVIPQDRVGGGFVCPKCLGVAIGSKWALHAKYCPDCGQHIKISTSEFMSLKQKVPFFTDEQQKEMCTYYLDDISGIYKDRMMKIEKQEEEIAGQMSIEDFMQM